MPKHLIFSAIFFLSSCFSLSAQGLTVERSIHGAQFNLTSLQYYYEAGLSDKTTLRFEAGALFGFQYSYLGETSSIEFALQPVLLAEPRYYYNLSKRADRGKRTTSNGGNFVGMAIRYQPDVLFINTDENSSSRERLTLIPRWGIRRNLGSGWDFELTLGYGLYFQEDYYGGRRVTDVDSDIDINWRFGFRF